MARNTELISHFVTLRTCGNSYATQCNEDYQGMVEGTLMHLPNDDEVMDLHDIHPDNLGAESGMTPHEYKLEVAACDRTGGYNTWHEALDLIGLGYSEDPPQRLLSVINTIQMVMYLSDEQLEEQIRAELDVEVDLTCGSNDADARAVRRLGRLYGYELADYTMLEDGTITIFDDPDYGRMNERLVREVGEAYDRGRKFAHEDSSAAEQGIGTAGARAEFKP